MSARSGNSRRVGYARVSTAAQTTDQQVFALRAARCTRVCVDDGLRATAKLRPGLERAKAALRPGDVFVVWAIDRAFRSTIEAILFLDDLMGRGIAFQSLTQAIDTRTPEGRKWYIDTASWAEYERAVISRRTKEKMAQARRDGQHIGRPYKLSKRRVLTAHRLMVQGGLSLPAVAARCRVSPITITRAFARHGLEGRRTAFPTPNPKGAPP
ncbi:MAG: recombinase family protein [Alphaproteobacteria bacterium]|nr:recombinase family protein [Alphaproteobacteria bacterium]